MDKIACPAPIPGIEWELTSRCNYACSYCLQRADAQSYRSDCSDATAKAVLNLLRQCSGSWLVKLSGGEPFLHPRFFEIIRDVVLLSHRVATTTNFSASRRVLERFLDVSGTGLAYLTASLHLEQMPDVRPFFDKARWFQSAKSAATKFVVTTVAIEAEFPRLKVLAGKFSDAGIAFEVAPRKCGSKFLEYTDPAFIEFMNSHALAHIEDIRGLRLLGSLCHTGSLFARVNLHGDGLRCYNMQPRFALGNVVKGDFKWLDGPKPCLARRCTCTVPANRNMIEYGHRVGLLRMVREVFSAVVANGPALIRLVRIRQERHSALSGRELPGKREKRLLYLSGALRVSTRSRATVGGARSHVLGVMKAFRKLHWRVSSFIVGDLVPLRWASRSLDRETRSHPGKRIAADLIRLLCGYFSGLLVAVKFRHVDWVYERAGSFQNLGARLKKKGVPWILETNALLYQEAFMDRDAIFFHRLAKKMEIRAYRNCDVLVCVSEGLKERVVAASGIDPQKIVVAANGVDADIFNPDIRPVKRFFKEPTIGFVGTMYAWQGLDLLLSALAALPQDDCGRKLVLVGDGPELNRLGKLAEALGLGADVHFSGRVDWQDIPSVIARFDIGYSGQIGTTAGDWYGSPIKIYEFMAMRKPIIASAWEDACRVVVPGRTGYLFKPGDRGALTAALAAAFKEKEKWPEMGRLARIEIERSHSWTASVRSMIPQLETILRQNEER